MSLPSPQQPQVFDQRQAPATSAPMLILTTARNLGAAALAAALLGACAEPPPTDAPSVVLVTIDTLRSDHLDVYGYPRETAPFLRQMAQTGTRFTNAIAACSHTAPAHASIFTSMSPLRHRVVANGQALREDFDSLASLFQDAGYDTLAFTSVSFLGGLRSGFDEFYPGDYEDTPGVIIDRVVERLGEQDSARPFFLWIHIYDPHQPYSADESEYFEYLSNRPSAEAQAFTDFVIENHGISPDEFRHGRRELFGLMNKYDAEIRVADAELARLYDYLNEHGLNAGTRWTFIADHGEGLRAHGLHGHDRYIYQEQLHIPLIFHQAGDEEPISFVSDELVRQVDVLPTLLDWAGLKPSNDSRAAWEGTSLVPILEGRQLAQPIDYAFSQRRFADPAYNWVHEEVYALQNLSFKYIWHEKSEDELYDLTSDPLELDNRIGRDPKLDRRFQDSLEELTGAWQEGAQLESIVDGDGHLDELEALGYTDGGD